MATSSRQDLPSKTFHGPFSLLPPSLGPWRDEKLLTKLGEAKAQRPETSLPINPAEAPFPPFLPCAACGILIPRPGIKPRPLRWKRRVLSLDPPGQSTGDEDEWGRNEMRGCRVLCTAPAILQTKQTLRVLIISTRVLAPTRWSPAKSHAYSLTAAPICSQCFHVRLPSSRACCCGLSHTHTQPPPPSNIDIDIPLLITILLS